MKKIINSKKYDTETAKRLAHECSNLGITDFAYWSETLYVKKTGEFFLHGHGGPLTEYATRVGQNSWTGGENIVPLTEKQAMEWVERNANDDYERIFGEVAE